MSLAAWEIRRALKLGKLVTARIGDEEKKVIDCRTEFGYRLRILLEGETKARHVNPNDIKISDG